MHFNDISWWLVGSRSRPGPPGAGPAVRRCGAGRCGSPSHTLALDFHSREQSSGQRLHSTPAPAHSHPASSQFLPVQPAAVTSSSLITLSLCPRTPDRQHRWLTALQCCYLHQWGRGWSLVATVDTMVRPCVGGSDASSRPAPGACRWMVPCLSTLQHPPR